jgi:hypothetical protein
VGVAFGPDGNLYVGSRDTHSVVRYDGLTGNLIDVFVAPSSGGLADTEALAFGPDGHLYVTEYYGDRVLRYDGATGAFIDVFASDPSLNGARSMTFGSNGNLYVTGTFSNNVVRFDGVSGALLDVFASGIPGANGLSFGPDGNLYVAAQQAGKIMRFDGTTGAFIDDFAEVPDPIGVAFAEPTSIPLPPPFVRWEPADGGNGHAYQVIKEFATWHEARDGAPLIEPPPGFRTGHLVTVSNDAENEFLYQLFSKYGPSWLGFTDELVEGEWRWIDDTPGIWQDPDNFPNPIQTAYANWNPSSLEPNDCCAGEDYGELFYFGDRYWNDGAGGSNGVLYPYVVEFEPVPEPSSLVLALSILGLTLYRGRKSS